MKREKGIWYVKIDGEWYTAWTFEMAVKFLVECQNIKALKK
jgi:hypothetical protein